MTESNTLPSVDTPFGSLQIEQSPWIIQDPYSFRTEDLVLASALGQVHLSFHLDVSDKSAIPSGLRCVFAVGKLTPVGDDRPALVLADGRSVGWLVHATMPDASVAELAPSMSVSLYDFTRGTGFNSKKLIEPALDQSVRAFVKDTISDAFDADPTFALRLRKAMLAELVIIRDSEVELADRALKVTIAVRDQAKALLEDADTSLTMSGRPSP